MFMNIAVGIDLGGTHITVVVINLITGDIHVKSTIDVTIEDRKSIDIIVDKVRYYTICEFNKSLLIFRT